MYARAVLVGAVLLGAVVYGLRLDDVAGLYVDDAWYILLAKALAAGRGFTLINAPAPGIMPFYPPGFPLLLAGAFLIGPEFPANLWLLKSVSIAALLAATGLAFVYFEQDRRTARSWALALSLGTLFHPAFLFLATSTVMSEPVFTLTQLAAILLIERSVRSSSSTRVAGYAVAGAAMATLSVLVRSIAVPLLPAAIGYLLLRRRLGTALIFASVTSALLVPWLAHARAHGPTAEQRVVMNDAVTCPYAAQFWMRVAGHPQYGSITPAELPRRAWGNARRLGLNAIGALHVYPLFRAIEPAEWTWSPAGGAIALILSLLTAVGFIRVAWQRLTLAEIHVLGSLAFILLWPFDGFRFLLPMLPFMAYYAAAGTQAISGMVLISLKAAAARALPARMGLLLLLTFLMNHVVFDLVSPTDLPESAGHRSRWQRAFDENRFVLAWVAANLPPGARLASHNPAMVYLYTGRSTVGYWDPRRDFLHWRAAHVSYWVDCWFSTSKYPDLSRSSFPVLYRSPDLDHVVLDLSPRP